MTKYADAKVASVFNSYPKSIQKKLMVIRQLIFDMASENEAISPIVETLKWGEPSYASKRGSPVRIAWKSARAHEYAMYFNCQTKLVDTFRELHGDKIRFEGNRAMVFNETDKIPVDELKQCILLALTYHDRKHLVMLGA